jgi:ketose-bisphosphate aldolase
MPDISLRSLLRKARARGYAVPAFNVVDQAGMDGVLDAALQYRSPVVVQISERTARFWGPRLIRAGFAVRRRESDVTAILHLDHCGDPAFVLTCLNAGWDSALYDSSALPFASALDSTKSLVDAAARLDADIEGEFERIVGVGDAAADLAPVERCVTFARSTGIACLSPNIGTRHGLYESAPEIHYDRVRTLAAVTPVVLHGGSGLSDQSLRKAVKCGVSKVNFSSLLKAEYVSVVHSFAASDPLALAAALRSRMAEVCGPAMSRLGSAGQAT